MTLVLSSELAHGATGTQEEHVFQVLDVVAKLAFTDEDQRERLKHEFSIYCHLASKGVKNIPMLLGLLKMAAWRF